MTSCPHPPTHCPAVGPITQANDAADYLEQHNLTGLLDGMMAALMITLPDDPVDFMQRAVNTARDIGIENVDWRTIVGPLHPHRDPIKRKLFNPPVPVDGGNLPVGVLEKRDFTLSLTDEETMRKPRLPFWHVDYFTQPQLDDPDFFLAPDWPLPDDLGPPVDVLGMPDEAAVILRPARLCPSPPPPPETVETAQRESQTQGRSSKTSRSHQRESETSQSLQSQTSQTQSAESQTSVAQSSQQQQQEEDNADEPAAIDLAGDSTTSGSSILPGAQSPDHLSDVPN